MSYLKKLTEESKKTGTLKDLFLKSGYIYDKENEPKFDEKGAHERVPFLDFVTENDLLPLMKRVITSIVYDGIQPNLMIVDNLFTVLPIGDASEIIEIQSMEDVEVAIVGKGGDYPQSVLAFDNVASSIAAKVEKVGAQLIVEEDIIKKNQYAIVSLWLSSAGKALAKFKENRAINTISTMGTTVFDNASATSAFYGSASGRDINGDENGSFTILDYQKMYTYLSLRGFKPDTLIINPLAWQVLSMDPLMREIVLKNGVVSPNVFPNGSAASGFIDPHTGRGIQSFGTGTAAGSNANVQTLTPVGATFTLPASTYVPTPIKVLVSHLVPYRETSIGSGKFVTNIIMADSSKCGILYQEGGTVTNDGFEKKSDTYFINIYEKYGFGMFAQGKGVILAKNIVAEQNYVFDNVNSQTLSAPAPKSNKVVLS